MGVSLNLVVIRVSDLEQSRRFYEALGLRFTRERHGNGPEHLAVEADGIVFEVYAGQRPVIVWRAFGISRSIGRDRSLGAAAGGGQIRFARERKPPGA